MTEKGPSILTLIVSLLFTAGAWAIANRGAVDAEQARFDAAAEEIEVALRGRWAAQEQVLRSGVAYIGASESVDPMEWRLFVETLELEAAYPGIQGVGWSVIVPPDARVQHEAEYRQRLEPYGLEAYSIYPVPGTEHADSLLTSIVYLEPLDERNERAISLDMYSERTRRAAMDRAWLTGEPSLSGKILLVQEIDEDKQAGFLLYLPVYRSGPDRELRGWVYSPFRARDLMTGILGNRPLEITFEVFDGAEPSEESLLYDEDGQLSLAAASSEHTHFLERSVMFAGRLWTLRFIADAEFASRPERRLPLAILIAGLLVSLLLSSLVWSQGNTRERAVALATRMTTDLRASETEKSRLADELLRSNKDLEEFAFVASHDLQEPARTTQAYLGLLEADLGPDLDPEALESLHIAKQGAAKMRTIVKDLLEYSRAARPGPVVAKPVNLSEVVRSVLAETRSSVEAADAEVIVGEGLPTVAAPESAVERVLANLVSNALKYRSPDRRCRVEITAMRENGLVGLSVTDNGIGIEGQHLPRLFQMHSRMNVQDEYPGNGMGLAISRQSIERAGGRVGVRSEFGAGSTFWFTLPEWSES